MIRKSPTMNTKSSSAKVWTRTAGLLFLAASAVYNGRAVAAGLGKAASPAPSATPLPDAQIASADEAPSALPNAFSGKAANDVKQGAAAQPATQPSAKADAPATQPSTGKSVSASEVAVSKDSGTVEIHVNDANIVEVLRMLSMQANTNILPSKEVRGTVTVNLYDMTIREALDAILKANGYGYKEKGNVIYVYSAKEIADLDKQDHKVSTEVFRLFYTPAVNAQTMIKPVLSSEGQVAVTTPAASGIDAANKDTGGNAHAIEDMLVVSDYSDNLERVRKILKEIDRRPQQILVEATILRCALSEDNALGVDFALLGGVDFHGLTNSASNFTDALSGNIINNQKAGGIVDKGFGTAGTGFTSGVPAGGFRAGIITNNVAVFVQALEEVTNTVVMANPKVLVLNKQKGNVKVARLDPFRGKTTVSETGLTQQEVDFLETGTLLTFRPFIGEDGYIRMEVHPEDSTPLPSRAADLPPTKLTTETTTNIMCKDGHTVVIGGLFRETSTSSKAQVPLIGNIPILGNLFKRQADSTQREEVIILLTPHVIKDDALFSKLSLEQQREAEKLRVGVRRGMMPIGRERLAECSYEQAVSEWNKPNPNRRKVLWHLDCAINLNPTFSEAIELKQKVTGKEVTTADNSSIRGFVRQMVLMDVPQARVDATTPIAPTTQPSGAAAGTAQASTDDSDDSYDDESDSTPSKADTSKSSAVKTVAANPTTQPASDSSVAKSEPKSEKSIDPATQPAQQPAKDATVEVNLDPVDDFKDDSEKSDK